MKHKIIETLSSERHKINDYMTPEIHIVDWKNADKSKGIEILKEKQEEINSVCLFNQNELSITIDAFEESALQNPDGTQVEQCECISFPTEYNDNSWILAVETKYVNDEEAAFKVRKGQNYPKKMVSQIISTVDYFREHAIIKEDQMVHAIISFPNLVSDFNSTLFSLVPEEYSVENLIVSKKIRIKGCNAANIISPKRIKFITN